MRRYPTHQIKIVGITTMSNKRYLFITQEIEPYLPENPVSKLGNRLPQGLQENGYEVRTFMPRYGKINERRNQLHEVIRLSGINIPIDDTDHPLIIKVASMLPTRIQVYFIDNDDFFQKSAEDIDVVGSNRSDNDERAIFFTRGTLETVKKLRWEPGIIQCQGWMSALSPLYIRALYDEPVFKSAKIVYSIVPGSFEGKLDPAMKKKLIADGVPAKLLGTFPSDGASVDDLHKLAITFSDAVILSDDSANPELIEYAKKLGKPVMSAPIGSTTTEDYANFYESLA